MGRRQACFVGFDTAPRLLLIGVDARDPMHEMETVVPHGVRAYVAGRRELG